MLNNNKQVGNTVLNIIHLNLKSSAGKIDQVEDFLNDKEQISC